MDSESQGQASAAAVPNDPPLAPSGRRLIRTPWGDLAPQVDLLPLWYMLVLYGLVYFLPLGAFEAWRKGEDGLAEWIQFFGYFAAGLGSLVMVWLRRGSAARIQWLAWLALAILCLYVAAEEISWGERLTQVGLESVRQINAQRETNLHNIPALQNYLHVSFIAAGLLFGWFGWRWWPWIEALPARRYSLYFLFVALFYTYWDLSWITLGDRIRNDQEAIEVLMGLGLVLHVMRQVRPALAARKAAGAGTGRR